MVRPRRSACSPFPLRAFFLGGGLAGGGDLFFFEVANDPFFLDYNLLDRLCWGGPITASWLDSPNALALILSRLFLGGPLFFHLRNVFLFLVIVGGGVEPAVCRRHPISHGSDPFPAVHLLFFFLRREERFLRPKVIALVPSPP